MGPYNPNFVVDGLALGGTVYPESAIYKSYTCRPSDDFAGFTWCTVEHAENGNFGPHTAWVIILHSSANRVAFITKAIAPAFFQPGDVDREIQRLSRGFGQAQRFNADPRPGVPHAVLVAWGAVTLTPLDEAAMDDLRNGEQIHRGLIAEFIGDAHKSARIGLPVYSIGGGPGYLWGASFDDAGKGSLRISAVDASALGPPQPPPLPVPPSPDPNTPRLQALRNALSNINIDKLPQDLKDEYKSLLAALDEKRAPQSLTEGAITELSNRTQKLVEKVHEFEEKAT